jgi:hypothetical protein
MSTTFSSGQYVQPIPVGLLCSVNYAQQGFVTSIVANPTNEELPFSVVTDLCSAKVISQRISTISKISRVDGVIVITDPDFRYSSCTGDVPECYYDSIIKFITKWPTKCKFYAYGGAHYNNLNVATLMLASKLRSYGFSFIGGISVTANSVPSQLDAYIDTIGQSTNKALPIAVGYNVSIGASTSFISRGLVADTVKSASPLIDESGYVHWNIVGNEDKYIIPYSDAVAYDASVGTYVMLEDNAVVYSISPHPEYGRLSNVFTCPICGKQYTINDGATICADSDCPSRNYKNAVKMLVGFGLDQLPYEEYIEAANSGEISSLQSVLNLPQYADREIKTTLTNLLFSILPVSVTMGNIDNVAQFVRQAKSQTAVHYYINNPDKAYSELRLNPMFAKNLVDWFSDGRHAETFDSIIHNQNIEIVEVQKKFKGDPIFINKKICIAGKFQHGSLEEITSILNSYSADVTLELTSDCSCLVVGHFRGEPKQIIDLAQSYNIPVYVEDEFFSSFQIDNDLEKLHLI